MLALKIPKALFARGLFYCLLIAFVCSCSNDINEVNELTLDNLPSESAEDIELISTDSAKIEFVLTAPFLDRYIINEDSSYVEFLEGLNIDFYDRTGTVNSQIKAQYAIKYEPDERIFLKDSVVIVNENGDELNTEELWWDETKDSIYTNKFVKITTKDEVLYGDTLISNGNFTKYKIKKVKGIFNIKDEELP